MPRRVPSRLICQSSTAAGTQTNVIVTFNPTTTGPRTTTLRVLSNDATRGTIDVTLTGRLLTAIENWRKIYFGSIANSGNGGDLNDYKKDGTVNLLKFAFGLNPVLNTPGQIPQPQRSGTNFVASFIQPSGVSGITYGAEWSTTLLNGSWTPIPDTGSGAQHTFSLAIGTVPKLFMRLKVTDPNP